MNLILLTSEDFLDDTRVCLSGRRREHVARIVRAKVGDRLQVGVEGGRIGRGEVLRLDETELLLRVELDRDPPPRIPLRLALALPRPLILKRVLQVCAATGVEALHLFHSRRVEKTFWGAKAMAGDALRDQLRLGLEQAVDTRLPELHLHPRFRPFAEDVLPGLVSGRMGLLAHPGSPAPCPRDVNAPLCLGIGPEGGFLPFEVERLGEAGLLPVDLGPRILRVDVAVASLVARLF